MSGQSRSLPFLQRGLEHSKYSGTSNLNSRYGGRSWIGLFVDDTQTRMSAISGKALKREFISFDNILANHCRPAIKTHFSAIVLRARSFFDSD